MRNRLMAATAALALAATAATAAVRQPLRAPGGCPMQPSWQPHGCRQSTFADGFNQQAISRKWQTWTGKLRHGAYSGPFNPGYETARYWSGNVSEAGGYARLKLTHVRSGPGYPWTGAVLQSRTFRQTYGAFEARVCLPQTRSHKIAGFPAWWQTAANWPTGGEIDTVEGLNDQWAGQAATHIEWTGDNGPGWDNPHPMGGCHRFGENWARNGVISFHYDGRLVWSHYFPAHGKVFLVFDNTLAPDSIQPHGTTDLLVDWVRVWR